MGIKKKDEMLIFNKQGHFLKTVAIRSITYRNQSNIAVETKSGWGVVNTKFEEVIPPVYDNIYFINEKYILLRKDEKYGIADTTGKLLISCKYDIAPRFVKGDLPVPSKVRYVSSSR